MQKIVWAYKKDPHATHQPILYELAKRGRGRILEFGAGYYSTPIIYDVVHRKKGHALTFESDPDFVDKFFHDNTMHFKIMDVNWNTFFDSVIFEEIAKQHWDLIFVDQSPWEARTKTIEKLKDKCDHMLIHDCGYFTINNLWEPRDHFKSYKVWLPPQPWPYKTGPPTLIGSNFLDCSDTEVMETTWDFIRQNMM